MDNQIVPVEQKLVTFNGNDLLGIRANNGKIYVGVRWICEGIGLKESQKDVQVQKIQNDIVLNQGAINLSLKFQGQVREILAIDIEFLPLWLAKISITPTMRRKQPEVVQKIVNYQMKAKDALAEAFVINSSNLVQIPTELNMIGQLLEVSNQSFKAMIQMKNQIEDADRKADEAIQKAEEAESKNNELAAALDDVQKGLVDVDLPLRSQFNDAVKTYKGKTGIDWDVAYNNIYKILAEKHHVNIKLRAQRNGKKPIDIIEELNLLVPAIRIAKTLGGIAS